MKQIFFLLLSLLLIGSSLSFAQNNLDENLEDLLADYVDENDFGLVLYLDYDGEKSVSARGLADLEAETPIRDNDLFRLASITKSFVSTIVLQLVTEGKMDLDNPIADYLPDELVQNIDNVDDATLRQVLQMTSGIYDYIETDAYYEAVYDDFSHWWEPEEVLSFIYDEDAYFEAGEGYYYSNSNYILAQIAIERLTNHSLAEELETRIFEPLGMDSCYLETIDNFGENIVHGYELDEDEELLDMTKINDGVGLGDGGIICSAADLGRFLPALMKGRLLTDEMLDEMLDTLDDGEGEGYGLGIIDDEWDFGREIWHDGASSGFQSLMLYLPDEELMLVILTNNFDSEIIEDLAYDALSIALDE